VEGKSAAPCILMNMDSSPGGDPLLNDKDTIIRLQADYARRLDARDAGGFAALFTETAELVRPDGHRTIGTEKIRKAIQKMPIGGTHIPGEASIEIDGDKATSTSRFTYVPPEGAAITGTYNDQLVRTPHGWRFSLRQSSIVSGAS
jgi:uncharacterized protein (TIGR02246 family)